MAKDLRKTLGKPRSLSAIALRQLMGTQSKRTLCHWGMDYAELHVLPLFERRYPDDPRPGNALRVARAYLAREAKFPQVKAVILKQCHAAARELAHDPVAQAAARACGQAASAVHMPEHALGVLFYGAAAIAYDRLGFQATPEAYEAVAEEVCQGMMAALRNVAVADESNPACLKWRF